MDGFKNMCTLLDITIVLGHRVQSMYVLKTGLKLIGDLNSPQFAKSREIDADLVDHDLVKTIYEREINYDPALFVA